MRQVIETSTGTSYDVKSLSFTNQNYERTIYSMRYSATVAYCGTVNGYYWTGASKASYTEDNVSKYLADNTYSAGASYSGVTDGKFRSGTPDSDGPVVTFSLKTYYTVTVSSNDTSYGTVTGGAEVLSGSSVTISATPEVGYKFVKWSDGNTNASRTIQNITADASYVAQFEGNHTFKVKFYANGGTGTMSVQSFVKEVPQALTKNAYKKTGYVFKGWNTKSDGTGTAVADGADGTSLYKGLDVTVKLYAQWRTPNFSSSKVDVDGGDASQAAVIELVDMDGKVLADDSGGSISYECTSGRKYVLKSRNVNKLWTAKGVESTSGSYEIEYEFVYPANQTSYTRNYCFSRNRTYRIVVGDGMSSLLKIDTACDETDEDGNQLWLPQTISVKVTPQAGKKLSSYNILDIDTAASRATGEASGTRFSFAFTQASLGSSTGLAVYAGFDDIKYTVKCTVDSASSTGGSVLINGESGPAINNLLYGEKVTLTATPATDSSIEDAYAFVGWFSTDGSIVSDEAEYEHTVDSDIEFVAKFSVLVDLHGDSITYGSSSYSESCSTVPSSPTYVTLGESVDYSVVLGDLEEGGEEKWKFDGWYTNSQCSPNSITGYDSSGTITPSSPVSLYAKVVSQYVTHTVKVYMVDREAHSAVTKEDASKGGFTAALSTSSSQGGGRNPLDVDPMYGITPWEFSFTGTRNIEIVAADVADWGTGTDKAFSYFSDSFSTESEPPESSIISKSASYRFLLNKNVTIYAYYGSAERVKTTLAYGVGDRSMGYVRVVSATSESQENPAVISSDGLSVETEQTQTFTVEVSVNNGYVFKGLYLNATPAGSPKYFGKNIEIPVTTERTLYSWFEKDTNAVCEWEGSNVNKMMTWRSKVYASPRPFNASSIRIDALNDDEVRVSPEYKPVVQSVSVEMFSAPDSSPTAVAELTNVKSQTVRRLPIRRMEKYMQVCVENDHEVLEIAVGTSSGGLAI